VLGDTSVDDPGRGLAAAINAGARELPSSIKYLNWLGDDDLCYPGGINRLREALEREPRAVLSYGACAYIDENDFTLFVNRPGRWAVNLMRFGPQFVSQPATLIRRDAFQQVGGLDEQLGWAFDLDLFIKLAACGKLVAVPAVTAGYRWHAGALSVSSRADSVREASLVRKRHLLRVLRPLSWLWEPPMKWLIFHAGRLLSRRYARSH
jgi:GT2 family glycosyltransferase